jgi:hypothetical protein
MYEFSTLKENISIFKKIGEVIWSCAKIKRVSIIFSLGLDKNTKSIELTFAVENAMLNFQARNLLSEFLVASSKISFSGCLLSINLSTR